LRVENGELRVMRTTNKLLRKLMELEGLSLEAYRDAAGVVTIGYGHTKDVEMGDKISPWWAKELLVNDIREVEEQVRALGVARTEAQLDALVSFAFNLGITRLKNSTLLRFIREQRNMREIKREWNRWVFAGGQRLKGLERRRAWEARRFFE
jgi:lysozyme